MDAAVEDFETATRPAGGGLESAEPGPRAAPGQLETAASRFGTWILAAAFLATPMTTVRLGDSVTVADLLLVVAGLLALVILLLRPRMPLTSPWIWAGGSLIVLSILLVQVFPPASVEALVESFSGTAYGSSLTAGARLFVALIVLPVAVSVVVSRWSAVPLLVNALVLGVAVSCSVAFLDAYIGTSIQTSVSSNVDEVSVFLATGRHVGLTAHPNSFAMTLVVALPLVLARMTSTRRLLTNLPLCALMLLGVLLSGSRAGLIGIAVVVTLSLALNPRLRSTALAPRVLIGYAASLAAVAVLVFAVPLLTSSPDAAGEASQPAQNGSGGPATISRLSPSHDSAQYSDSERRQYFEDSVGFIVERPLLGYGFQWIETSHNIFLQLLMSGGLFALAGYLLVMSGYMSEILRLRTKLSGRLRDILVGLGVAIAGYLVVGMVSTDLIDRYLYLPAALVLAMSALAAASLGPVSASSDPYRSATADE